MRENECGGAGPWGRGLRGSHGCGAGGTRGQFRKAGWATGPEGCKDNAAKPGGPRCRGSCEVGGLGGLRARGRRAGVCKAGGTPRSLAAALLRPCARFAPTCGHPSPTQWFLLPASRAPLALRAPPCGPLQHCRLTPSRPRVHYLSAAWMAPLVLPRGMRRGMARARGERTLGMARAGGAMLASALMCRLNVDPRILQSWTHLLHKKIPRAVHWLRRKAAPEHRPSTSRSYHCPVLSMILLWSLSENRPVRKSKGCSGN